MQKIIKQTNLINDYIKKEDTLISKNISVFLFENYTIQQYKKDIEKYGLNIVWQSINEYIINNNSTNKLFSLNNLSHLYELGLETVDKNLKKENGQYYTPADVATVMSNWLNELDGDIVCDIACGTGNLIMSYLDVIGFDNACNLIKNKKLYLYDKDNIALSICKTILIKKYGADIANNAQIINCDFLDKDIVLPHNCKVISNPPYSNLQELKENWNKTQVANTTKELYSMFIEKIITQSKTSVIISPYSFIGGNKFYSLRKLMNNYNGFIVCFDNVPGNIFCGKKLGIFNSNTSNSVRAAITVIENKSKEKGFRVSPLLRFKTEERTKLLNNRILESFIPNKYQIISKNNISYYKCHNKLINVFNQWNNQSTTTLKDYITKEKTNYVLYIPNTCRYFTTAATTPLDRKGIITLNIKDEKSFQLIYCIINSSFAYWWWRLYDGGITYTQGLLQQLPIFENLITAEDKAFFADTFNTMKKIEKQHIVTKRNAGKDQENIKFPIEYRNKINQRILSILNCKEDANIFDLIHSNYIFK